MNIFSLIGIHLLVFFGISANNIRLSFKEFSLLSLKENNDVDIYRKNAMIQVQECSPESMNLLLGIDQVLKFEATSYSCYVKNLTNAFESCKRRCAISRNIGKCRGIENRLAAAKEKYNELLEQQTRWGKLLSYCIKCRALTEYMLIKSRGGIAKKSRITSRNSGDDPAYTPKNLFDSYLTRDLSSFELLYLSRMDTYLQSQKKLCKTKSRALCSCAKKTLKDLKNNKNVLQSIVIKQDSFQRRWFTFNEKNILGSGDTIDSIKEECEHVLEKDAEIQNGINGNLNAGFTKEELEPVTSVL
ncbi:unnamed protein product [Cryptosporidium hominis]|uniref:Uncharacterized protein n=1 Tax=Cryptosporidium hominis TaxID=237895 RepID=A0A0S4TE38_CRYHO|nr:hypothetical protein [Cryptosporidium hominis TU502]OLQ18840.1 hypothetical protein ChTU502y2012_414g0235 [Cryptosporidium hominis]PPA62278.1 hypothetical protein ChUKH1_14020 [Cryptosporidium hominis]PPS92829.1 Uncharacterized protein GY17_00002693 [Cryptosporidium hominis]CUV05041.1 unnamed protein product [Cryptosporidium hominis]|eukprot:PPS92829.1 Uncharacterized protein GY17_00002693 [Cryptosporidium hominis]